MVSAITCSNIAYGNGFFPNLSPNTYLGLGWISQNQDFMKVPCTKIYIRFKICHIYVRLSYFC